MQMMRSKSLSSPSPSNQGQQQADLSDLQLRKKLSSSFTRQLQLNTSPIEPQTYAIVNSILRSSISFNSCKICEKKLQFNQLISLTNCDHKFCQQCLTQYCLYKIKVNEDVLCPEQGCKQKLTQESKIYKQLPIQMQQKFKQHQVWKQSLQNPNIKLCPNEKCVGGQVDLLKIPPECGKCGKKYCKECMMDFHEGGCDQNFQQHFKQWKRCPKCKVFIQKNEGCNHMTCTCTHQFCFVCLANWQNSHYQCVEGNNRLFYNELQSMPKEKALLNLIGMIFALPLLVLVIAFIIVMGAAIAFLVAVICAPCIGIGCMRDCGFICKLLCLVIVIPIITVVGAGLAVLISIFLVTIPYSKKLVVKYSNTCKFLLQQLRSKQDRPLNIVSTGAMMEQI